MGTVFVRSYNSAWSFAGFESSWASTNGNTMGNDEGASTPNRLTSVGDFVVKPNTWNRIWIYVEQRADDWDSFSMYMADENNDRTLLYDAVKMSVSRVNPPEVNSATGRANDGIVEWHYPEGDSNTKFGVGFDESGKPRTMVSYWRNFFVLVDPPPPAEWAGAGLDEKPLAAPLKQ